MDNGTNEPSVFSLGQSVSRPPSYKIAVLVSRSILSLSLICWSWKLPGIVTHFRDVAMLLSGWVFFQHTRFENLRSFRQSFAFTFPTLDKGGDSSRFFHHTTPLCPVRQCFMLTLVFLCRTCVRNTHLIILHPHCGWFWPMNELNKECRRILLLCVCAFYPEIFYSPSNYR